MVFISSLRPLVFGKHLRLKFWRYVLGRGKEVREKDYEKYVNIM